MNFQTGKHFKTILFHCWFLLSYRRSCCCVPAGRWRSIDRDRRCRPSGFGCHDRVWVCFPYTKRSSVDTISLPHLSRRSSNNCDLQLANCESQIKDNCSIDAKIEMYACTILINWYMPLYIHIFIITVLISGKNKYVLCQVIIHLIRYRALGKKPMPD